MGTIWRAGALALAFALAIPGCASAERQIPSGADPFASETRDADLLTDEQKELARETGRAAVKWNGTLYILEDVPEEFYREDKA